MHEVILHIKLLISPKESCKKSNRSVYITVKSSNGMNEYNNSVWGFGAHEEHVTKIE